MYKKSIRLVIFLVISFGMGASAYSKQIELQHVNGNFSLPKVKDWSLEKDMFGMPFLIVSPQENGQRSNISFTPMGKKLKFESEQLKKKQSQYLEGRQKWAKKVGAQILSQIPYKFYKNEKGNEIHKIGVEYIINKKHYVETSYYISCNYNFYYSKGIRLSSNGAHDNVFNQLIDGFHCHEKKP